MIFLVFLTIISAAAASESALKDQVRFFLYNTYHPNTPIEIGPKNASKYLERTETKIIIHGWMSAANDSLIIEISQLFVQRDKINVIAVDYDRVDTDNLFIAVNRVSLIGEVIADLIVNSNKDGFPLKSFQVIGGSLGGQVAGQVGKHVQRKIGQKLELIIALDPAGPLFYGFGSVPGRSLNAADAINVFVLHTDRYLVGASSSIGTVDVFPNNGAAPQPGCSPIDFGCSHGRVGTLYLDAIRYPGRLVAAKCNSYNDLLAGKCNNTARVDLNGQITANDRGDYYSKTTGTRPYDTILPPK